MEFPPPANQSLYEEQAVQKVKSDTSIRKRKRKRKRKRDMYSQEVQQQNRQASDKQ